MDRIAENVYRFSRGGNNAYFIDGDEKVLIDGTDERYVEEYIAELSELADISEIKYIVINHSEYNRSGTLAAVLERNPSMKTVASTAGLKFLHQMLDIEFDDMPAKNMGTLKLGDNKTLTFILAPYIDWPDSMMTLYESGNERLLFSCDLFSETVNSAYYPDFLKAAVNKTADLGGVMIFPGTGAGKTAAETLSGVFAARKADAVIVYRSNHGTTERMAELVKSELEARGIDAEMYNAAGCDPDFVADRIDNAGCVFIGANTINADMPRELWQILAGLKKDAE